MPGRSGAKVGRPGGGASDVHDFIGLVVSVGRTVLAERLGVPADRAEAVARDMALAMCRAVPRTRVYIPLAIDAALAERDMLIWSQYGQDGVGPDGRISSRRFTRARVLELAAEYQLSEVQMYNILRLRHRQAIADVQSTLEGFGTPPPEDLGIPQSPDA